MVWATRLVDRKPYWRGCWEGGGSVAGQPTEGGALTGHQPVEPESSSSGGHRPGAHAAHSSPPSPLGSAATARRCRATTWPTRGSSTTPRSASDRRSTSTISAPAVQPADPLLFDTRCDRGPTDPHQPTMGFKVQLSPRAWPLVGAAVRDHLLNQVCSSNTRRSQATLPANG
jgi:hypothetical protein